jgi:hypothetical protein
MYQNTHTLTHSNTHKHTHTPALVSGHAGVQWDYHIIWKKASLLFLYLVLCAISVR